MYDIREEPFELKQLLDHRFNKIMELQQRLAKIWHMAEANRGWGDDIDDVLEKIMKIADPGRV